MRSFVPTFALAALGAVSVSAAPFTFPTEDNFPDPSAKQLEKIQEQALGTLPNGPPPPYISAEGLTNLKLIALNELFEVAYFTELYKNVTDSAPGYEIESREDRDFIIKSLEVVIAQEKLHAINVNGALELFGHAPIEPCQYDFPVASFDEAIALAGTFTSLVLGTLQDVTQLFAQHGDFGLTRSISSVVGQEGEQEGWYRLLQGKVPSELPFLTTGGRDFAFTAIQGFTVPGSCPNIETIPLKTFKPLTLLTPAKAEDMKLKFSWEKPADAEPGSELFATYINQQNVPITVPLAIESINGQTVIGEAEFPYTENLMNGLTIASLTNSEGPFPDAASVAEATIFGPALIVIN